MKRTIITAAIAAISFLFGSVVKAQTSPLSPMTVAGCRAEEVLWSSKIDAGHLPNETAEALAVGAKEMSKCMQIDSPYASYATVVATLEANLTIRFERFLIRHKLSSQFKSEDKAGAR